MAVKFVRTCDRCGKVIREGSANDTMTVGEGNSLNFYTKEAHKSYDICDECATAFEKFMANCAYPVDVDVLKSSEDAIQKAVGNAVELVQKGTCPTEPKHEGWSDEVLELARRHNEKVSDEKAPNEKKGEVGRAPLKDKSTIKLAPGTHTYHRWTVEEDRFLAFHSASWTLNALANKFGTTIRAVKNRRHMILNGKININRED